MKPLIQLLQEYQNRHLNSQEFQEAVAETMSSLKSELDDILGDGKVEVDVS